MVFDFPADAVKSIVVHVCDGDDKVDVHDKIEVGADIFGGDGDDHLKGGRGDDLIVGGPGRDKLYGRDGDDFLDGGDGRDDLKAGDGDDILLGGAHNDKLKGENGRDVLIGGIGKDSLDGGKHDDVIIGGHVTLDRAMLEEVRRVWNDDDHYSQRVEALTGPGGLLRLGITVLDDDETDQLKGGKDRDLFYARLSGGKSQKDKLKDRKRNEELFR